MGESSWYVNPDTGFEVFLIDGADLLTDAEEAALAEDMIPVTDYGNCTFESAVVTGQDSYSYVKAHYSEYFQESGTLFLIDMGNRQIKLYSSGEVEKTVTPSYANSIADNIYTLATDGKYYECASRAFAQESTLLQGGRIAQPMKYISCALLALIAALLFNYFIVRHKSKNTKTPQRIIMQAVAAAAAIGTTGMLVTKREHHSSGSGGSSGGGGGGGGGGGFSGGGHSF